MSTLFIHPDGHYYWYSLKTDTLESMAQRLLKKEDLPRLAEEVDLDAYDRKVLEIFTDQEGRITASPAQEKKFVVLLHYVVEAFGRGQRYSEKQVNEMLARYNEDIAYLRRSLVEHRLMAREGGGREYWRPDQGSV